MNTLPAIPDLDRSTSSSNGTVVDRDEASQSSQLSDDQRPSMPVRVASIRPVHNQDNQPSSSFSSSSSAGDISAEDLGYEDATPDPKYGYHENKNKNDNENENEHDNYTDFPTKVPYDRHRVPRRSSLKCTSTTTTTTSDVDEDGSPTSVTSIKMTGVTGRTNRRASMGSMSTTTVVHVRMRGERHPVQRRRSIDFDTKVDIKEVRPLVERSTEEELWLTPDEFAQMKIDRRAMVQKLKMGEMVDSKTEDIRGLEKYLDRSGRVLKNMAWDAVLIEQDEQELKGVFNEERIAQLYRSTTGSTPDKAAARAKEDQEAVRDYLMSPRTTKLMMRRLSC